MAGADISELAGLDEVAGRAYAERGDALARRMERLGKPILACINGFALGGGCELAMACTLRLASETARLGQPEVKLGILAGFGGTQRLPRLVGRGAALKLLLTGEMISAAEALRIGLVDEVVPGDGLMARAEALALAIAANAPIAVERTLLAVDARDWTCEPRRRAGRGGAAFWPDLRHRGQGGGHMQRFWPSGQPVWTRKVEAKRGHESILIRR